MAVAEPYLGVSLVPTIKAGAGATIGVGYAAKQPADGYTWVETAPTPFYRTLVEKLPYSLETFTSLGLMSMDPSIIFVHADSPWQTLQEMVEDAKARPGEITVGRVGLYGPQHMTFGFIGLQEGAKLWNYVPQPGGGPAMAAVLGKHNDTSIGFPAVVGPQVKAGLIRALAVCDTKRLDYAPFKDVPTLIECGYDYTNYLWIPMMVRADTPPEIVAKSRDAFKQIMEDASFNKLMGKMGAVPVYLSGPDCNEFLKKDLATAKKLVEAIQAAE